MFISKKCYLKKYKGHGEGYTLTIYGCKGNQKLAKTGRNIHIFYQQRAKSIILKARKH